MKHLLNTLYVSTQGAYLHKEGMSVLVEVEKQVRLRVPVHNLQSIVCFGNVICSPFLLGFCAENQVAVAFLTENGRFLASVRGSVSGNVLLRRTQYRWADDPARTLAVARAVVLAKLANARNVLLRGIRDGAGDAQELTRAAARLKALAEGLSRAADVDGLRGLEGDGGRAYFGVIGHLVTQQTEDFRFEGRSRRPPLDPFNAMLSFLYTMLMHDITGALEGVGLDPCVGYLHRDRPGRKSLALDLMEEFRPWMADRLVLSLINRKQIQPSHFEEREGGAVWLNDRGRKVVIEAWQARKQEEIRHPFLQETVRLGLFPHIQALLLARHLRGDLEAYPPMLWK